MLRILRNLTVNIMAALGNKDSRNNFRNKYKRKSNLRQLTEDNKGISNELIQYNKILEDIQKQVAEIRNYTSQIQSLLFRIPSIKPLDLNSKQEGYLYLSIACIARDEAPYLKEWIEYHKLIGVQRIYFYDNGSTDNTKEVLENYINSGFVIYKYVDGEDMQIAAYHDAIFNYRNKTRWIALIDVDEFIVPVSFDNLCEFLKEYEEYPALAINWVTFDSCGHKEKPNKNGGLVIANYTRVRADPYKTQTSDYSDLGIKCIVNPSKVIMYEVHSGIYYNNACAVTEDFVRVPPFSKRTKIHSVEKIRLNHYYSKSHEEYIQKLNRARYKGGVYKKNFQADKLNFSVETKEDLVIQKYLPKLNQILDGKFHL